MMALEQKKPLSIRWACMSLMWGWCNLPNERLEDWLREVSEAGYDGVGCFEGELLRLDAETPFRDLLAGKGLRLASVDYFIDEDFNRLRRVCAAMQSHGARHLVALGGMAGRGSDMGEIANLLNRIGRIALEYDVLACLHNHTDHTAETLEEAEALLALTDPGCFFGFLDVGHATKDFAGHPLGRRAALFLERNWERIAFLEFKDWSEANDLATEVGSGATEYEEVFRILKEKGYAGWITVEQNGPSPGKTAFESAKASRDFIRTMEQ